MPVSTLGRNAMLTFLASIAVAASLHDLDPGDTGDHELTGGLPAYARRPITWDTPSGASMPTANAPLFDVPAGAAVRFAGFWSSGGLFLACGPVTEELYAGQGTYTLDAASVAIA